MSERHCSTFLTLMTASRQLITLTEMVRLRPRHITLLKPVIIPPALLAVSTLLLYCADHVRMHDLIFRHFRNPFPDVRPFQSIPRARQSIALSRQARIIRSSTSLTTTNQQWQVNGFSSVWLIHRMFPESNLI